MAGRVVPDYAAWFDAYNNLILKVANFGSSPLFNSSFQDSYTGGNDSKKPSLAVDASGQNLLVSFVQNGALKVLVVNYANPNHYANVLSPCSNQTATFAPSLLVANGTNYVYFARASDHALSSCSFDLNGNSSSTNNASITLGTSPSAVFFQNVYHVFFKANDSSNRLYEATNSTPDSTSLVFRTNPQASHTSTGPSALVYDNTLYVGFRQNDANNHAFFYTQTGDGVNYSSPILVNWSIGGPPMLVANQNNNVFNIFRQNDNSSHIYVAEGY